jgi:Skp family chaperone for outer membrane proteins
MDRLEKAIEKMSDKIAESDAKSHEKMDKLTDSINTLLLAQTAFYEHKETITRDVEKLEAAHNKAQDKAEAKYDEFAKQISAINVAIGQGGVFDDINNHKLKNMIPWTISLISLGAVIFVKFGG